MPVVHTIAVYGTAMVHTKQYGQAGPVGHNADRLASATAGINIILLIRLVTTTVPRPRPLQ